MVLPSSSGARKWLWWHVDCWDTEKSPYDHDGLAVAGPGVQMKLARLIAGVNHLHSRQHFISSSVSMPMP